MGGLITIDPVLFELNSTVVVDTLRAGGLSADDGVQLCQARELADITSAATKGYGCLSEYMKTK